MTAPDYAALVEKARTTYAGNTFVNKLADAIERLTQPVVVDAIGWLTEDGRVTIDPAAPVKFGDHWRIPIYSAETVARLVAERDALKVAAQAVIDRWDSPKWKDEAPTADFIARLRRAVEGAK